MSIWSSSPLTAPPQTEDVAELRVYLKTTINQLAVMMKELDYVLNGNVDFKNVRAQSIDATRLTVDELSAITANLGTITAGIIRGISIYGSLISTNETGYPKASISNTGNFFDVSTNAGDSIRIEEGIFGDPAITFTDAGTTAAFIGMVAGALGIQGSVNIVIGTSGNITLNPTGVINVPSWSDVVNQATGRTLQQDLDVLTSSLSGKSNVGHTHSVTTTAGGGTFTTSS